MAIKPMKTPESANSGEFELIPAGVYVARCYKMIDVGTQSVQYMNNPPKPTRQIYLYWEILQDADGNDVRMADGERVFSIFKQYTWSMNEKANLRKDLNAWRGQPFTEAEAKDFDVSKLLEAYCLIQVVHRESGDRTYANVDSIMATTKKPEGINEVVNFVITDPDMEIYENLPDWLKAKVQEANEWATGAAAPKAEAPKEVAGKINDKGEIEIEDLDKKEPEGVTAADIKKLPF